MSKRAATRIDCRQSTGSRTRKAPVDRNGARNVPVRRGQPGVAGRRRRALLLGPSRYTLTVTIEATIQAIEGPPWTSTRVALQGCYSVRDDSRRSEVKRRSTFLEPGSANGETRGSCYAHRREPSGIYVTHDVTLLGGKDDERRRRLANLFETQSTTLEEFK